MEFQPPAPIPADQLIAGGAALNFVRPDGKSRCTWNAKADKSSAPHIFEKHLPRPNILPNVLHAVGNTPLIRLNSIPKSFGIKCEILAKCEFFNPAGSVKDRIAIRMITDAENRGLLKPGDTIIEPTSGNTGLGLAMAAAVKGYKCVIVMPMKMSNEKVDTLKALGAEIIRTPTSASFDSPEGLIAVAQKLCKEIPNSIILDQYRNAFNPIAHYEHTGQEIIDQCEGKVDAVVLGAGTGGTISGVGRKIKEVLPNCKVIAADPLGSSLSLPDDLNKTDVTFYEVEGIGYDFIPTVLDRSVVDKWYKSNDRDSLALARRLIREEGLLCGGSSGAALSVAIQVAKTMTEGQRLVVVLPDGMRNYMTKFIDDSWMRIRDFKQIDDKKIQWWSKLPAGSLINLKTAKTVLSTILCNDAITTMKALDRDFVFVKKDGKIVGVTSTSKILTLISESKITLKDPVEKAMDPVRRVDSNAPLERIAVIVQKEKYVLIEDGNTQHELNGVVVEPTEKYATADDILLFISSGDLKNAV